MLRFKYCISKVRIAGLVSLLDILLRISMLVIICEFFVLLLIFFMLLLMHNLIIVFVVLRVVHLAITVLLLLSCLCILLLLHHLLLHLHVGCLLLRQVLLDLLDAARLNTWPSPVVRWNCSFVTTSFRSTHRSHVPIPTVQVYLLVFLLITSCSPFVWWSSTSLTTCPKIAYQIFNTRLIILNRKQEEV